MPNSEEPENRHRRTPSQVTVRDHHPPQEAPKSYKPVCMPTAEPSGGAHSSDLHDHELARHDHVNHRPGNPR